MNIKIGDIVIKNDKDFSDFLIKRYIYKEVEGLYEYLHWDSYLTIASGFNPTILFLEQVLYTDIFREFK